MRHRRVALLSIIIALAPIASPTAFATTNGPSSGGGATVVSPIYEVIDEAQAIRFRETFGLDSSLATVRAAAIDTAQYSSELYGLPLSDAEVADLLKRAQVQRDIKPAFEQAATYPTFAGAYLDQHAGGQPVFMFTKDAVYLPPDVSSLMAKGVDFRVIEAEFSMAELLATQARVDASWSDLRTEGIGILETGIATDRNAVAIGVQGLTESEATALRQRFGPSLIIEEARPSQADACNNSADCRPLRGGIELVYLGIDRCTSGFVVKQSATAEIQFLTAGHCIAVNGGYGATWYHNGTTIGDARRETWHPNHIRGGDVGLIDMFSAQVPTTKNLIHIGSGNSRTVAGWDSSQYVGDQSCRFGINGGLDCGSIVEVNITKDSPTPNDGTMKVTHTNVVNFDSLEGDSGGPFFYYGAGSYVIAQGTHVHSGTAAEARSWFTPIAWGRTTFDEIWGYSYSVCVNSSCT